MKTDHELMAAYRAGDRSAFERLVRRHWSHLFAYLKGVVRDEAGAEEALSATLYKLHTAADRYEPRGAFKSFLFTIARREAISWLRARRKDRVTDSLTVERGAGNAAEREIPSRSPGPADTMALRQALRAIDAVLDALPEGQRTAFLLYYREGMSTDDIAGVMELSPGSVRAYLTKARRKLREIVLETHEIHGPAT